MSVSVSFCMPNRWTFEMQPVAALLHRWIPEGSIVVDPFSGRSTIGTIRNDIAESGVDSRDWLRELLLEHRGKIDVVVFDPPYSPRQISECYKAVGRTVTKTDTQSARLYREMRDLLAELMKPGGIAISFGWNSMGFGKDWERLELLLVQHGGAHNDTICVVQRKPTGDTNQ